MGPCMMHQGAILLPFIGMTRDNIKQALKEFLFFHAVRLSTYTLLGALGGIAGYHLNNLLRHRFFIDLLNILLGLFLMGLAVFVLFQGKNLLCRWTHKHFIQSHGKAMILAGFFTALTPCPALLGLLAYTAASQRIVYGALAGLCFAAGTVLSPIFLAIPLWGALKKFIRSALGRDIFILINACLFFAFGFYLIMSTWRSL